MKRILSTITAFLLANTFMVSVIPTKATDISDAINCSNMEVGVSATDSIGKLLAKDLSSEPESGEYEQSNGCLIHALEMNDIMANVQFQTPRDGLLIVALYSDDGTELYATGTQPVYAGETNVTVTIDTDTMPTYYLAKAFLADPETKEPLCASFTNNRQTQYMTEFFATTLSDFDEVPAEQILVLETESSEDEPYNFAVFSDDCLIVESNDTLNTVNAEENAVDGTMLYTITNAEEKIINLQPGDIVVFDQADANMVVLKVADISIDANTNSITITEDSNLNMEELFQFFRLESTNATPEIDTESADEGVEVVMSKAFDPNKPTSSYEVSFDVDVVHCTGELVMQPDLEYYVMDGEKQVTLRANYEFTIGGEITIENDGKKKKFLNFEMPGLEYTLYPGITLELNPYFMVELEGSMVFSTTLEGALGMSLSRNNGCQNLSYVACTDPSFSIEASAFFGFGVEAKICLLTEWGVNIYGTLSAGVELSECFFDDSHACEKCISAQVALVRKIEIGIEVLSRFGISHEFRPVSVPIGPCYYSFTLGQGGFGACPNAGTTADSPGTDPPGENTGAEYSLSYRLISDGNGYEVSLTRNDSTQSMPGITSITIPNTYNGKPVINIAPDGFANCSDLETIKLPSSLTDIGGNAFLNCISLTDVQLPHTLQRIDAWAFYNCDNLSAIELPLSLTDLNAWAFGDCNNLTYVELPYRLQTIDNGVFYNCKQLKNISIPGLVTRIGCYAFYGCSSLQYISLPISLQSLGEGAFAECTALTNLFLPRSISSIPDYLCQGCTALSSVTIQNGIQSIGNSAFAGCTKIRAIDLPDSITTIGSQAFALCANLTFIQLSDSLTELGDYNFIGTRLCSLTLPATINEFSMEQLYSVNTAQLSESVLDALGDTISVQLHNTTSLKKLCVLNKECQIIGAYSTSEVLYQKLIVTMTAGGPWPDFLSIRIPMISLSTDSLPITGYINSTAHQYAIDNDLPFTALDAPAADDPAPEEPAEKETVTLTFTGLTPNMTYYFYEMSDSKADLSSEEILYIMDGIADEAGTLEITYVPQETTDETDCFVVGTILFGDINADGLLKIDDVILMNRFIAENTEINITADGLRNADCCYDGTVDTLDSLLLLRYLAALVPAESLGAQNAA